MTIRDDLIRDEGRRESAYPDSLGFLTIGVGHLIDARKNGKLPGPIIDALLDFDIAEKESQLDTALPWWRGRTDDIQRAMLNLCFQLGIHGLQGFSKMLSALHAGDNQTAADELLNSSLATQAPDRTKRTAELIRNG